MLEFFEEYGLIFVIVGSIIILIAIGYIVDKFVINKGNKKSENKDEVKSINEEEKEVPEGNANIEQRDEEINENEQSIALQTSEQESALEQPSDIVEEQPVEANIEDKSVDNNASDENQMSIEDDSNVAELWTSNDEKNKV